MNIVQIVFSPTGGTQRVADILTEAWGGSDRQLDLTMPQAEAVRLGPEDLALIAVPSYGGRVPALAAARLGAVQGQQTPCVILCVYGNRAYEDTLVELQDIVEQQGFLVAAGVAAVAEHSIMHQYATGRPDQQDQGELQAFAGQIMAKINAGPAPAGLQLPGNRPYKKSGNAKLVPKANAKCVACGICAAGCPAQAISPQNPAKTEGEKCIGCMRCVVKCPKGARQVNSAMLAAIALALKKACAGRKDNQLFI